MSSFKGSQGRSGFRHSKIKWNIFKELLLNNAEGSQRVCRDGSGVFLGEPDYLLHFWRLNVVQGCKTNRGGIWLRLRPWWQECGSLGLRYSLQQRRSWGAGWIPALYVNCSFTVPSQDFNPPPQHLRSLNRGSRGRKHWGTDQHRWLLDLVTLKPTTWTPKSQTCFSLHFPDNHMQYTSPYASDKGQSGWKCTCVKDTWSPALHYTLYQLLRFNSVSPCRIKFVLWSAIFNECFLTLMLNRPQLLHIPSANAEKCPRFSVASFHPVGLRLLENAETTW